MNHSISVIIPAYNAEAYICQTLASVAAQSRPPEQIIIVDDGSNDRTVDLITQWRHNHTNTLQLLRQKNQGVSAARNAGIHSAQGDLVAFLDADDLFLPNHLERLEQGFKRHPHIILCFADAQLFSAKGIEKPSLLAGSKIDTVAYEEQDDGFRLMCSSPYMSLLRGSYIPSSASLCSKRALEQAGLFDETIRNAEDRELWLRLSRIGVFAYYPFVLAQKRLHAKSLMHTQPPVQFQYHQFKVLQKMVDHAKELSLSAEELWHTREARLRQAHAMLYAASRDGLKSYVKACLYLTYQGFISPIQNPRHFLRALTHRRR